MKLTHINRENGRHNRQISIVKERKYLGKRIVSAVRCYTYKKKTKTISIKTKGMMFGKIMQVMLAVVVCGLCL